jgi:hypothetical protein
VSLKSKKSFSMPEELCKTVQFDVGVFFSLANDLRVGTSVNFLSSDNTPPRGNNLNGFVQVLFADYKCRIVEHFVIGFDLARKTFKSIGVTLEFVAMKMSIHNGDVDSHVTLAKAKFVQNLRLSVETIRPQLF